MDRFYTSIPAQEGTRVANLRSIAFLCAGRIGTPPHLEHRIFTPKWSATIVLECPGLKARAKLNRVTTLTDVPYRISLH